MEDAERIHHCGHGDEREQSGTDLPDLVTEVEKSNGQTAEDDAEIQPREECAFIGEEDFWFDPDREGDAFAYGLDVSKDKSGVCMLSGVMRLLGCASLARISSGYSSAPLSAFLGGGEGGVKGAGERAPSIFALPRPTSSIERPRDLGGAFGAFELWGATDP